MESLVHDIEGADDAYLEVKEKCGKIVMEQIKKREEQLKLVLQKVERDIRTTFSEKEMVAGSKLE